MTFDSDGKSEAVMVIRFANPRDRQTRNAHVHGARTD